jgi:hypothetical protein
VWSGHSCPLLLTLTLIFACHPEEADSHAKRDSRRSACPEPAEGTCALAGGERTTEARPPKVIPTPKNMFRPTFTRGKIIYYHRMGLMSPKWRPRNRSREAIWTQAFLACAALFALLVIRTAPPDFPRPPSLHQSSVDSVSSHNERPRFDWGGSQWSAPVSHFLPFPPVAYSAHSTPVPQLWSVLQSKGFHYNRPPPTS